MRFLCMVLSCVALRGLGSCGGGEYKAEVHVVSSDPREYDVSVTSTTYPVVAKDSKETAESRPSPSPSPLFSSPSSASGTHDLPCRSDSSSTQEHAPAIKDSTLVQIVTSPKDRSAPCCIHDNSASRKVDASSPSPALPPQGSPPLPTVSREPPNNAARWTREIKNNSGDVNQDISPGRTQRTGGVNYPTPAFQVPQTHAAEHTQPKNTYANETQAINTLSGYTAVRQVKATQASQEDKMVSGGKIEPLLTNQTVNLQNASNNHFSIILQSPHHHAATSQLLDNYTRAFQRALINQSATIQPKLTNQTPSQQVSTSQTGTFQHTRTHQAGNATLPKILQSAAIQQTAQEDPISETGDTQQDQIEQSGAIQQAASQTSSGEAGITQTVPNQSSTPQQSLVSPSQSPLQALQLPPNPAQAKKILSTPPQVTVSPPSPLEALQAPPNQTQATETLTIPPQTIVAPASTPEASQAPPSSPQTPEFIQVPMNQTEAVQQPTVNQSETMQQNPSNHSQTEQVFANQTETSPGNASNLTNTTQIPSVTGSGTPRSIEHASKRSHRRSSQRRKGWKGRGFANATKARTLRKVSKACPCAGKVIQRMTTCKKPCTRNNGLLWKLFYIALIIWVVYVLFLFYVHRWFRRRLL